MRVVGLMSGTSVDGVDVAIADLTGAASGSVRLRPLGAFSYPWPPRLRHRLLALLPPNTTTTEEVARLDVLVGEELARAATRGIAEIAHGRADLVVSHGQTVFHWVEADVPRGTLQIGQPAPIAEATGLPVVSDVRARDIAAGGHGAPLASTLDALLLREKPGTNAALNLGGIANATVVTDSGEVVAYDTGPASCLIDATVARLTDGAEAYDRDGTRARRGVVDPALLGHLLTEPYLRLPPPKSTGRELFTGPYVEAAVSRAAPAITGDDLIATLTEFTAQSIANSLAAHGVRSVFASGGGVHNPVLMDSLARKLPGVELTTTEALGLPVDDKEAYLMALLGYLTWHGLPGVLPGATGSRTPTVLGRITPAPPSTPTQALTLRVER